MELPQLRASGGPPKLAGLISRARTPYRSFWSDQPCV